MIEAEEKKHLGGQDGDVSGVIEPKVLVEDFFRTGEIRESQTACPVFYQYGRKGRKGNVIRKHISDNVSNGIPVTIQTTLHGHPYQLQSVSYNVTQESHVLNLSSHEILFGQLPAQARYKGVVEVSLYDCVGGRLGVLNNKKNYISQKKESKNEFKQSWHDFKASPNNCLFDWTPDQKTIWSIVRVVSPANGSNPDFVTKHIFSINIPKRKDKPVHLKTPLRKRCKR